MHEIVIQGHSRSFMIPRSTERILVSHEVCNLRKGGNSTFTVSKESTYP